MEFTVAVIKNKEFPKIEHEHFLKQFLYEHIPKDVRKSIKDQWTQFIISKIDNIEFKKVSTFPDMCGLITNEPSKVIETEMSYPMSKNIYEIMYVMEPYDESDFETSGINYLASLCSIKHYPVKSTAVLLKTDYAGKRCDINMTDILRIIRRRNYYNVIVSTGTVHKKYSIQDIKYFSKLIFGEVEVVTDVVDVAGIKLDIIYRDTYYNVAINDVATRFLGKKISGPVIVKCKSLKSNITCNQFLRFSVLSYKYKEPWHFGDSHIPAESPILDIDEYKISKFMQQWKQIKNICQTCGKTMDTFRSGLMQDQRVCSEECLR
jgi:hypothetical protein